MDMNFLNSLIEMMNGQGDNGINFGKMFGGNENTEGSNNNDNNPNNIKTLIDLMSAMNSNKDSDNNKAFNEEIYALINKYFKKKVDD